MDDAKRNKDSATRLAGRSSRTGRFMASDKPSASERHVDKRSADAMDRTTKRFKSALTSLAKK